MTSSFRRALALAGLALGGLCVGLVGAELVLRAVAASSWEFGRGLAAYDPLAVLIEPMGTTGYRLRPHALMRYPNGTVGTTNSLGFRGREFLREKAAGVVRIVLIGGSTTYGWSVSDDETIASHMERLLREREPTRTFEVINAAQDGYDSFQILERLRHDVTPLRPDIVVVNSGINDVRNARFRGIVDGDPRTLLWTSALERLRREQVHGPTLWTRAKHYSLLLRLPGFMRLRMYRSQRATEVLRAGGRGVPAAQEGVAADSSPLWMDAADYFARNIRRIAVIAEEQDFGLILSTPPSALRLSFAPSDRSVLMYWLDDAETTAIYRDSLAARMSAIADSLVHDGRRVRYLRPVLPSTHFLDDAHLSSEGNRVMASAFVDAALELLRMNAIR